MEITTKQIRSFRLHSHHLDKKIPFSDLSVAAGAVGLQNSPPGAWGTALFNRLKDCTPELLNSALYQEKTLLQAWSYRGVPVVFPTEHSDIFLTPLIAQVGEQPWIYTLGITGALDYLQIPFDDLLACLIKAASYLDNHTIKSKESLDQTLADIMENDLPEKKTNLWRSPSIYGNPQKQTVGGAAVSFLLRPCSFLSLVVFGERQGPSPTFTSFRNWVGYVPSGVPDAEKKLVRKFLHCYGPATKDSFTSWLGCSVQQAHRLWNTIAEEVAPIAIGGKTHYILTRDIDSLLSAESGVERLMLLGAHDPYLDLRDRTVILENKALHKIVWKYVANPGAILQDGCVIGIWKTKTLRDKLDLSMTVWEAVPLATQQALKQLAEEYAAFRGLRIRSCTIENL